MGRLDRLGRIRIPPIPKETALVDRVDGKTYKVVKANGTPTLSELTGAVDLNRYWLYQPFEGPVVEDDVGHQQRLFASSGSLSFERSDRNTRSAPVDALVSKRPLEVWRVTIEAGALSLTQLAP